MQLGFFLTGMQVWNADWGTTIGIYHNAINDGKIALNALG